MAHLTSLQPHWSMGTEKLNKNHDYYLCKNHNFKFLLDSIDKDIKEFKKRKFKNIIASTGLTAAAGTLFFLATFSLGGDFYFGP